MSFIWLKVFCGSRDRARARLPGGHPDSPAPSASAGGASSAPSAGGASSAPSSAWSGLPSGGSRPCRHSRARARERAADLGFDAGVCGPARRRRARAARRAALRGHLLQKKQPQARPARLDRPELRELLRVLLALPGFGGGRGAQRDERVSTRLHAASACARALYRAGLAARLIRVELERALEHTPRGAESWARARAASALRLDALDARWLRRTIASSNRACAAPALAVEHVASRGARRKASS